MGERRSDSLGRSSWRSAIFVGAAGVVPKRKLPRYPEAAGAELFLLACLKKGLRGGGASPIDGITSAARAEYRLSNPARGSTMLARTACAAAAPEIPQRGRRRR